MRAIVSDSGAEVAAYRAGRGFDNGKLRGLLVDNVLATDLGELLPRLSALPFGAAYGRLNLCHTFQMEGAARRRAGGAEAVICSVAS